MITLRARAIAVGQTELDQRVWLISEPTAPPAQRAARAVIIEETPAAPEGFGVYLCRGSARPADLAAPWVELPESLHYLGAGDVVSVTQGGRRLHVLWRQDSHQNSLLLTERCDHFCLMCSQPPKQADDDVLLEDALEVIRLLPRDTADIAFTGGEPTLYGERLFQLLRLCRSLIPQAAVHVLSNGRRFNDRAFAHDWARIDNPNMMVGIPIYGAEPSLHDYVVQAAGAFDETVRGILNLGTLQQRIEIRVVIHQQTARHLPEIAEFIARNLPFVEQVALMGLEMIGFARANIDDIWIDPVDYRAELAEAVGLLHRRRIKTMVYNHQLCLLDRRVWPFAVRSISDWKNEYHPECLDCGVADRCGGFFFSAKYRHSNHIKAIQTAQGGRQRAVLALSEVSRPGG